MSDLIEQEFMEPERLMSEQELRAYEFTIERGIQTYIEVGSALKKIRDQKGYRFTHATFADYVESRWKMSVRSAYENITAAQVSENVRTSAQIGFQQAVSIGKLPDQEQKKFVDAHDVDSMSVRKTNEAVKEWQRRAEEAERQLQQARRETIATQQQAQSLIDRDRQLREENEKLKAQNNPEPVVVEKPVEVVPADVQQRLAKQQETIRLLESTNSTLATKAQRLDELEQSPMWEAAGARNEVTRIMNRVYADATKGFAEIETTYLAKLEPDMNTVPILDHIAEQFIEMGLRIKSWMNPQQKDPNYVVEGVYVDA